jgi:hypothetical protein
LGMLSYDACEPGAGETAAPFEINYRRRGFAA